MREDVELRQAEARVNAAHAELCSVEERAQQRRKASRSATGSIGERQETEDREVQDARIRLARALDEQERLLQDSRRSDVAPTAVPTAQHHSEAALIALANEAEAARLLAAQEKARREEVIAQKLREQEARLQVEHTRELKRRTGALAERHASAMADVHAAHAEAMREQLRSARLDGISGSSVLRERPDVQL